MSERVDLFQEIVRIRQAGRRAALATIVKRIGSTPRKDNAKMLVREDGSTVGSVGGGCVEAEAWQLAKQVIASGRSSNMRYEMTDEEAEDEGLVCGGSVEIFVEPIMPNPRLVILGAGHVGQAVAETVNRIGFDVGVVDDRESFASPDRFPAGTEITIQPFEDGLDSLNIVPDDFLLIVTRGHSHDQTALESAIRTEAGYVGLVGSRRKIQLLVQNLLKAGHGVEVFRNLYAPIGLNIGSETPEEIAVSVAAEMIALRKGCHQRSEKQNFIRRFLEKEAAQESGSKPRQQLA